MLFQRIAELALYMSFVPKVKTKSLWIGGNNSRSEANGDER